MQRPVDLILPSVGNARAELRAGQAEVAPVRVGSGGQVLLPLGVFSITGWAGWDISDRGIGERGIMLL